MYTTLKQGEAKKKKKKESTNEEMLLTFVFLRNRLTIHFECSSSFVAMAYSPLTKCVLCFNSEKETAKMQFCRYE